MQGAAFYSYINTSVSMQPNDLGTAYTTINTGATLTPDDVSISYSYLNLGLPITEQRIVVRGPRGWGILPVDKQEFTVFTDESKAKTYAYLYTKQP